ncbi:MerR family transcriptional regulator [Phytoactinopolyspora mesophila]|uniref:MerR family transcriptional regulator n=1 Tax=Phytoactinopolyspora mesophila TaxID=2650750 RepID=A0A7K3M5V6_9ACTN|nr:MerR family transcriptional regulator [Phytoactinopolyspora mesophila]NDL58625.1 MerR family transcriptional regulator [Phytoactinopolyspora mesophila]
MIRALSMAEVARALEMETGTIRTYRKRGVLPDPDVMIGDVPGWMPETIDAWNANRPGRGRRRKDIAD